MTDAPEEAEAGARSGGSGEAETEDGSEAGSTVGQSDIPEARDGAAGTEAAEAEVAEVVEVVEIPKQQSADEAADNEAGEGARK
ncbi:hypothetical protein [Streptomyces sp. Je 1-79]|uniref:hypothetical protein n=1 Tax=Streptomyces sp. Je 1-79 TaxID=2943847 RepID=UPI0027E413D7|nr:hypothetical protein [Streptomyces sp. Je 1-79]